MALIALKTLGATGIASLENTRKPDSFGSSGSFGSADSFGSAEGFESSESFGDTLDAYIFSRNVS